MNRALLLLIIHQFFFLGSGLSQSQVITMKARCVANHQLTLGEGSLYDPSSGMLYWVDIENGKLFWTKDSIDSPKAWSFGKRIGTVVSTDQPEMLVVALEDGIYKFWPESGKVLFLCNPEQDKKGNRFNDGKCSPAGSFWVGSMSLYGKPAAGALYRVKGSGKYTKMLDSLGISNGIVWSADHHKMYFIDTPTSRVLQFKYDPVLDTITEPSVCIRIPRELGSPDGMSIDAEGMLWIAHYGGGGVYRWDPLTGNLLAKVEIPAINITSCAFYGSDLKSLLITTARQGNDAERLARFPLSGGLFVVETEVKGTAPYRFMLNSQKRMQQNN